MDGFPAVQGDYAVLNGGNGVFKGDRYVLAAAGLIGLICLGGAARQQRQGQGETMPRNWPAAQIGNASPKTYRI